MRDVPKGLVGDYIHQTGLAPAIIVAAASGEPYAPAASGLLDAILNISITKIDLDDAQYQQGVAALVGYGIIAQADADAIESLYVTPTEWTYVTAVADGTDRWLLVFSCGSVQRSVTYHGNDPEGYAEQIKGTI